MYSPHGSDQLNHSIAPHVSIQPSAISYQLMRYCSRSTSSSAIGAKGLWPRYGNSLCP
ncbi:MAG: hypothetical protein F6J98_26705 [Moorea sp. SIO4G2]|nr:hypothetical protein [Moorena sp. SIO4G2]